MAIVDELRRRRSPGGGGYEGIGGNLALPGQMQAFMGGVNQFDFSGPMGRDFAGGGGPGGGGGLLELLSQGPAGRHFGRQGFGPPGQWTPPEMIPNQNAIGSPNIAPANMETGQALQQPGVPQGVARGQSGAMPPGFNTQGWRNYAPGYSAAAQLGYGTDAFGRLGGSRAGVPSTGVGEAPSLGGKPRGGPSNVDPGFNVNQPGPRPNLQGFKGPGGGGDFGATPGPGSGGPGQGGGGGNRPGHPGQPPHTAQGGVGSGNIVTNNTGNVQGDKPKVNKPFDVIQGGGNPFYDTIHIAPNHGNNNTPSETGQSSRPGKKKSAGGKKGGGKVGGVTSGGWQTGGGF